MVKKNKVEIIKCESSNKKCYICDGTGKVRKETHTQGGQPKGIYVYFPCKTCDGTGIFKDNHYILIVNGMAWPMDSIK